MTTKFIPPVSFGGRNETTQLFLNEIRSCGVKVFCFHLPCCVIEEGGKPFIARSKMFNKWEDAVSFIVERANLIDSDSRTIGIYDVMNHEITLYGEIYVTVRYGEVLKSYTEVCALYSKEMENRIQREREREIEIDDLPEQQLSNGS